jgi:hypothetical protein
VFSAKAIDLMFLLLGQVAALIRCSLSLSLTRPPNPVLQSCDHAPVTSFPEQEALVPRPPAALLIKGPGSERGILLDVHVAGRLVSTDYMLLLLAQVAP